MTPQETQVIANRSLNALNDNRVMVPCDAVEALADLKNILRSLINNSMVLVDRAPVAAVPEPSADEA
jgi:SepF-like predicted cell division protein (DUF552 family)